MTDAGNVGRNLNSIGQADASDFTQGRVRLLGGLGVHAGTHTALLRTSLQGRTLRLVPRPLAAASHQLIESRHAVPGAPQSWLPLVARTGAHPRKNAAYAFPAFRGWMADSPTMLLAAHSTGERFRFPGQTNAGDGGTRPELFGSGVAPFRQHCPA